MNSSKTWKSGELCRLPGTYRCQSCEAEGRQTVKELAAGSILPMCDSCVEKDATWKLIETAGRSAAGA